MLLMPDPNTANIDPFFEEPTLILTCDVIDPTDGKPYERDPRSLAKRAEAYMKSTGLGDAAYFGPEPEFFIFDSIRWGNDMSGCFSRSKPKKPPGTRARNTKAATWATARASRAATSRCRRSTASRTCARRCA
jgi:glutamine synthetase